MKGGEERRRKTKGVNGIEKNIIGGKEKRNNEGKRREKKKDEGRSIEYIVI